MNLFLHKVFHNKHYKTNFMKTHIASLSNALILVSFGLWGYLSSNTPSLTALIPVIIGAILLLLVKGIKNEKKIQAHMAVILTVIVFIGLLKPFYANLGGENKLAIFRVSLMIFSSLIAIIAFIKSFSAARKNK